MTLSIIVAQARNRVIGSAHDLPWYLPADLRHFKELTTGHTVIMGRKTYDSIVARLGKPLPNRTNVVLTRDRTFAAPGIFVAHTMDQALRTIEDTEAFVIGGAQIYEQAMPVVDKLYVTEVAANITGDTFFPPINPKEWKEVFRESHDKDDKNPYNYSFVIYERVG
jgi:dihydrofolate reductase